MSHNRIVKKTAALSLVECVVYSALVTIVAVVLYTFLLDCKQAEWQLRKSGSETMHNVLMLDILRRDLISVVDAEQIRGIWYFKKCCITENNAITSEYVRWQQNVGYIQRIIIKQEGRSVQNFNTSFDAFSCEPQFDRGMLSACVVEYETNNKKIKHSCQIRRYLQ